MKNKLKMFLTVAGLLLLIYTIIVAWSTNINFGVIMSFGISLLFLMYGLFLEKMCEAKWVHRCFVSGFLAAFCLMLFIAVYGQFDNVSYDEDAVIVLGSAVKGEQVLPTLAKRLDIAVAYHYKNPKAIIVVSGGQGPQEDIPEALAMERYLVSHGVAKGQIMREEQATSTYENFLYAKAILDEYFGQSYTTAFITSDFHIFRASRLASYAGLYCTREHAGTVWYTVPVHYARECAAIIKMLILKK